MSEPSSGYFSPVDGIIFQISKRRVLFYHNDKNLQNNHSYTGKSSWVTSKHDNYFEDIFKFVKSKSCNLGGLRTLICSKWLCFTMHPVEFKNDNGDLMRGRKRGEGWSLEEEQEGSGGWGWLNGRRGIWGWNTTARLTPLKRCIFLSTSLKFEIKLS